MTDQTKRWWCIYIRRNGQEVFLGRTEATKTDLRKAVGHYADIKDNGYVCVWGRP